MTLDPANRRSHIRRGPMGADIIRQNFTQIANLALRDKRISRRARGLLAELLTHTDGFRISVKSLQESGPEGRDAIAKALDELEVHGYLRRYRTKDPDTGQFGSVEFYITDMPQPTQITIDSDKEMEKRGFSAENSGTGKTAGQSSDDVYQGTVPQETVSQCLDFGPYKKTTSENTILKNTHTASGGAAAGAARERDRPLPSPEKEEAVAALCAELADSIKSAGFKRPKITYAWRDAARDLLSGDDAYTVDQVREVVRWSREDPFWASRTMTMAKLAQHFETIAIQARGRRKDVSTPEGKKAQHDATAFRMQKMTEFMADFEQRTGREMTDPERKALIARLKEAHP